MSGFCTEGRGRGGEGRRGGEGGRGGGSSWVVVLGAGRGGGEVGSSRCSCIDLFGGGEGA